jgi:hypothetical protein
MRTRTILLVALCLFPALLGGAKKAKWVKSTTASFEEGPAAIPTRPLTKAQIRERNKQLKAEQQEEQHRVADQVDWFSPLAFMPGAYLLLTVKGSSSVVVQPHLADNTLRDTIVASVPSGDVGQVRVDLDYPKELGWMQVTVARNASIQVSYEILMDNKLINMPPGFGVQLEQARRAPAVLVCADCKSMMMINASERPITISTCATSQPNSLGCSGWTNSDVPRGEKVTFLGDQIEYLMVKSTGPYACSILAKGAMEGNIRTFDADSKISFGVIK